jgi:hypothetical protein
MLDIRVLGTPDSPISPLERLLEPSTGKIGPFYRALISQQSAVFIQKR